MHELNSGDSVGAGTTGTGGILLSAWAESDEIRILLTTRETEWLIEQLNECLKLAGLEKRDGKNLDLTSGQLGVS